MRDKIHAFLLQCGGQASSVAIARSVFHLRHASVLQAENILTPLLRDDPRVRNDGLGNWHWVPINSAVKTEAQLAACLLETPMRPLEIKQARSIVLGVCFMHLDEIGEIAAYNVVARHATATDTEFSEKTVSEFWHLWSDRLQQAAIVSWNLRPAMLALRRLAAMGRAPFLPLTTIALPKLAQHLLQLPRLPRLPALYARLFEHRTWHDGLVDCLKAESEILAELVKRGQAQGLTTWEQFAAYARQPTRVNFGSYDFDERFVEQLPETPGVYLMKNARGKVIYVGKAANLRQRVQNYFRQPTPEDLKLQRQQAELKTLHYEIHDTELEALLREQVLIRRFKPALNRQRRIHLVAATQPQRKSGIFIVPLPREATATARPRVVIYFLRPQKLTKLALAVQRKPGKRLHETLTAFWQKFSMAGNGEEPTRFDLDQVEIAARWLQQNRHWISRIDPEECADLQDAEKKILALLQSPEIFESSVRLSSLVVPEKG
jgi:predicted GIY-YIG superfamily endonuclease